MPKNFNDFFASKEKAEATDSRAKALSLLYVELLRKLISRNILSADEVHEIFLNAVEQSSSREEEMIQRIYDRLTEPPDSEDSDVGEGEEEDSTDE